MKSCFITFEGVDGSGKSTQAALVRERLDRSGRKHLMLREPGSTPVGEAIRRILLNPAYAEMSPAAEVLLYAAARAQMVSETVSRALQKGLPVLCDRYIDSSLAYQAYGGGTDPEAVRWINGWATGGLFPDLTIVFDLDPSEARERRPGNGPDRADDRIEGKPIDFHRRVRQGYLEIAAREPNRVKIVDASRPPDLIQAEVWALVAGVLGI